MKKYLIIILILALLMSSCEISTIGEVKNVRATPSPTPSGDCKYNPDFTEKEHIAQRELNCVKDQSPNYRGTHLFRRYCQPNGKWTPYEIYTVCRSGETICKKMPPMVWWLKNKDGSIVTYERAQAKCYPLPSPDPSVSPVECTRDEDCDYNGKNCFVDYGPNVYDVDCWFHTCVIGTEVLELCYYANFPCRLEEEWDGYKQEYVKVPHCPSASLSPSPSQR